MVRYADPATMVPALKRGIERVKKGEPVMLVVVTATALARVRG